MITDMDHVVNALMGKDSLKQMPTSELRHLSLLYPYSSFLHLLKSRKLKDTNDPEYPSSVAMTALYFSNHHWLHHQLQSIRHDERLRGWERSMDRENALEVQRTEIEQTDLLGSEQNIEEIHTELALETIENESSASQTEKFDNISTIEASLLDDEQNPDFDSLVSVNQPREVDQGLHLSPPEAPPSVAADPSIIPFEPLYTTDYFASVGIRLSAETEPGDQLGTKLKSFTDWLKSMRKLHPEKRDMQLDPSSEMKIKKEAELSNDNTEVITETMAKVFLQQGQKEKAVAIYHKLSLLEPDKMAYFATKIAELKA